MKSNFKKSVQFKVNLKDLFPNACYSIMLHCLAEAQALPPVQVFDKTMVVKQMHVLEPQDLLITRADKGKA